jgi:hypothetical protein
LIVEVFGVGHDRSSGLWAADVIMRGKPDVICFEAWAEFVKLFNLFDSGRIDALSKTPEWKEVLPLVKWYWNFAMSLLEKEPIMRAAKKIRAEPVPIDVSIGERMHEQDQIRRLMKKGHSFRRRLWFAHRIFQRVCDFFGKPFIRSPSLMNSVIGDAYFQTARGIWDMILPESRWWGLGREEYMTQRIAEIVKEHEDYKIFVFVGAAHKTSLQNLIESVVHKHQEM